MKNLHVIPSLLATLLVVSNGVAQTADGPAINAIPEPSGISAARSKYLEKAADAAATRDGQPEAQLRHGRGMPIPRQRGYNRGGYQTAWAANSDPGHVLIGAGIGFAIGATIGAVGAVENGKSVGNAVFLGGSLFALFGAAIGASHSPGHPFMHRRRTYPVWPEDDAEGDLRSPAMEKNSPAGSSASREPPLSTRLRDLGASAATSSEVSSRQEQPFLGTVSSPKTQN